MAHLQAMVAMAALGMEELLIKFMAEAVDLVIMVVAVVDGYNNLLHLVVVVLHI